MNNSQPSTYKTRKIIALWREWLTKYADKKVALYGAGQHTLWLADLLADDFYQMSIVQIIDNNPKSNEVLGIPVVTFDDGQWEQLDFVIISSESFEQEIFESLSNILTVDKIGKFYDLSVEQIFLDIFEKNHWGSDESVSGKGSENKQVRYIKQALPDLFADFSITSILDIPCGDFNWMKDLELKDIEYVGGDIVGDLVDKNKKSYQKAHRIFMQLDLMRSELPDVELIFCRDCLVHLSYADIREAIKNIQRSSATYLLTTSFIEQKINRDIKTGDWRTLNLMAAPFGFPPPLKIIMEGCTEADGAYRDKSLCLWKIANLPFLQ